MKATVFSELRLCNVAAAAGLAGSAKTKIIQWTALALCFLKCLLGQDPSPLMPATAKVRKHKHCPETAHQERETEVRAGEVIQDYSSSPSTGTREPLHLPLGWGGLLKRKPFPADCSVLSVSTHKVKTSPNCYETLEKKY